MRFSFVVPVYKVEEYLPQCIESIISNEEAELELILIDDGSPDNSGRICDEYAQRDKRIIVIHKENGGVSAARNDGIAIAKGEYIWFLDSDDYLRENSIDIMEKFIAANIKADMITCPHINEYGDGVCEEEPLPFEYDLKAHSRKEFFSKLKDSNGAYWAPWKNIYRNRIIQANNMRFLEDISCAEDCEFFMNFAVEAENFYFCSEPLVCYRRAREGSIMNIMSKKAIIDQLKVFADNSMQQVQGKEVNLEMSSFFANKFANTISLLYNIKDKAEIDDILLYINKHRDVLARTKGAKYQVAKLFWKIFGYNKGSKLLRKIRP